VGGEATVEIERLDNFLKVIVTGRIDSRFSARTLQEYVVSVAKGQLTRALFDYREVIEASVEVDRSMLLWMQRGFDRAAILLSSVDRAEMLKSSTFGEGAKIRHFELEHAASNWLVTSDSWPTMDLLVFEDGGTFYGMQAGQVEEVIHAGEILSAPGLPAASLGIIEHHGQVMMVVPPSIGGEATFADNSRFVILRSAKGLLALLTERTHLLGRVAIEEMPRHGALLDSDVGPLVCVDADNLSAALGRPLPT
jgi:chemotaxis signal transduction protein